MGDEQGAVISIKNIYDLTLETKLAVTTMTVKLDNMSDRLEGHSSTLKAHTEQINDLYKKWYMAGGVGGIMGVLLTYGVQLFLQFIGG